MFYAEEVSVEGFQLSLQVGGEDLVPAAEPGTMGEVFTRRWVVELILDLAGYTAELDLAAKLAVEPACGTGAFLEPMVARLIESAASHRRDLSECLGAIRAFDLRPENVAVAQKLVAGLLGDAGVPLSRAERLAGIWVQESDFLLDTPDDLAADFVIGNPPYIRLEDVPAGRTAAYRHACPTMRGRSDVYVGFLERGLRLLADGGMLGFIVADRWMHNQYGAHLRRMVSEGFSVEVVLEMHDTDAFEEPVSAYPAITVIRRCAQRKAVLASADRGFGPQGADGFTRWTIGGRAGTKHGPGFSAARLPRWFDGSELWAAGDPEAVALVRSLEDRLPPLEDPATGTRVGIGVATGADEVYITSDTSLIEADRLLPLVMNDDITAGQVRWSGNYLANPWTDDGLVDLDAFPRLKGHYERNRAQLRGRHVAKARPATWYRTIDRVWPELVDKPKLLLPDMKASIHPVLEPGGLYPHHNLYYVTSRDWDLEVLGGLLLSDIANLFVGTYCVKMRGGCYRFQAQYLRKVRVPAIDSVGAPQRRGLRDAFQRRDVDKATSITMGLLGLDALPTSAAKPRTA
jgi:adenine-specific DNA-methyltransferase